MRVERYVYSRHVRPFLGSNVYSLMPYRRARNRAQINRSNKRSARAARCAASMLCSLSGLQHLTHTFLQVYIVRLCVAQHTFQTIVCYRRPLRGRVKAGKCKRRGEGGGHLIHSCIALDAPLRHGRRAHPARIRVLVDLKRSTMLDGEAGRTAPRHTLGRCSRLAIAWAGR